MALALWLLFLGLVIVPALPDPRPECVDRCGGRKPRYHHGNHQPSGRVTSPLSLAGSGLCAGPGEPSEGAPLAAVGAAVPPRCRGRLCSFVPVWEEGRARAPPRSAALQLSRPRNRCVLPRPSPQVCTEAPGRPPRLWSCSGGGGGAPRVFLTRGCPCALDLRSVWVQCSLRALLFAWDRWATMPNSEVGA